MKLKEYVGEDHGGSGWGFKSGAHKSGASRESCETAGLAAEVSRAARKPSSRARGRVGKFEREQHEERWWGGEPWVGLIVERRGNWD